MKRMALILALVLPVWLAMPQDLHASEGKKTNRKEVPASRLPLKVKDFIKENLPHAEILKVVKQKKNKKESWIVSIRIKTKYHTLVFDNKGEFVRTVKKQ